MHLDARKIYDHLSSLNSYDDAGDDTIDCGNLEPDSEVYIPDAFSRALAAILISKGIINRSELEDALEVILQEE